MTEMDRMPIVQNMFPDWMEHLSDGKIIDHGCNNVARRGRKRCKECAARCVQYMRTYGRRKTMNAKDSLFPIKHADFRPGLTHGLYGHCQYVVIRRNLDLLTARELAIDLVGYC